MGWNNGFQSLRLIIKTLSEFIITDDVTDFLDEFIQLFFPINERNHPPANILVDATKEMDMDPMEVNFGIKLSDEYLEFITELIDDVDVLT